MLVPTGFVSFVLPGVQGVAPALYCSELWWRGASGISREQPTLASCSTVSGQDEVPAGVVREFRTGSCCAVWAAAVLWPLSASPEQ